MNARSNQTKTVTNKSLSAKNLLRSTALTAAGLLMFTAPAFAQSGRSFTGFTDTTGDITTDLSQTDTTSITQNTQLFVGTSNFLDIADGYTVDITQKDGSVFVAKAGAGDRNINIDGILSADANIVLLADNIIFGKTSTVNVGGLVASTGDIADTEFTSKEFGNYNITNVTDGRIVLEGTINVAEAGLAAFVSPRIINRGIINAKLGKVAFASGEQVTLDLYGDGLVEIAVTEGNAADAVLNNSGEINAEGGTVIMTASQAKDAVDNVINTNGIINVASAEVKGGKIVLSGGSKGNVSVSGEVKASGTDGGSIDISGERVVIASTAKLEANGGNDSGDTGNGGDIAITAINDLRFNGKASAKGGSTAGDGGSVVVTAKEGLINGTIDASATNGAAGEFSLLTENACIGGASCNNASTVRLATSSVESILNNDTHVSISTGLNGADGDIEIKDAVNTATTSDGIVLNLSAADDVLINNTITDTGAGLSVVLVAGNTDAGTQSDVVIDADVTTNGGDFAATADSDVNINAAIDTDGGDVTLNATGEYDGGISTVRISSTGSIDTFNPDFFITERAGPITFSETIDPETGETIKLALTSFEIYAEHLPSGDITVTAQDIDIDGAASVDAGHASININRSTEGAIGLGNAGDLGDLRLNQTELNTLSAATLNIGNVDADASNTTEINVSNVDASAINTVALNALAGDATVNFDTKSAFSALEANAGTINVNDAVSADSIDFDANIANLDANLASDAITGDVKTVNVLGSTNGAKIQDGLDIASTGGFVNVADGTYVENLTIDDSVNLIGDDAVLRAATAGQALITVNASDVTIDPFVFDGDGLVDYGVYTSEAGANGLTVDGNTFRNFNEAGVFVENAAAGGMTTIENNIFEASSRRGVVTGNLNGGAILNLENNTYGSEIARIRNAIVFGVIADATVTVDGDVAYTNRDSIHFNSGLRNGADVTLKNVTADSLIRNAVEVGGRIRSGAELLIDGGSYAAGTDALKFADIVGEFTLENATVTSDANGLLFSGDVRNGGKVTIDSNSITGGEDAIKFSDEVRGATTQVNITKNTSIVGSDNGVLFSDEVRDGATINIAGNTNIEGQILDGVAFNDDVDGVTVDIFANGITGAENGVSFDNVNLENGAVINVIDNTSINGTNGDGVHIDDVTAGGATVTISGNQNVTGGDDGIDVTDVIDAQILNNIVTAAGDDAIVLTNSASSDVLGNTLSGFINDGVDVDGSNDVVIGSVNTITGGRTGVRVTDSNGVEVSDNTISGQTNRGSNGSGSGIFINNSDTVNVTGNRISDLANDGVSIENGSDDASVTLNQITNVADSGITIRTNSQSPFVQDNVIDGAANGIRVTGTNGQKIDGAEIDDNDVTNTTNNAVWATHTTNASITDNVISDGATGVRLTNSSDAVIGGDDAANRNVVHNRISNVTDAVIVDASDSVVIGQNDITGVTNGISVSGSDLISIEDNALNGTGVAINVLNTTRATVGGSADNGNSIDNFNTGIVATDSDNAQISYNSINVNGNVVNSAVGIEVNGGSSVDVDFNRIDDVFGGGTAIIANNAVLVDIEDNIITDGTNGIAVNGSRDADIRRNQLDNVSNIAISVTDNNDAQIDGNQINVNGNRITTNIGIQVNGESSVDVDNNRVDDTSVAAIQANNTEFIDIESNIITDANDGIVVTGGRTGDVTLNTISRVSDDAIQVDGHTTVDIADNILSDIGDAGITVFNGSDNAEINSNNIGNARDGIRVDGGEGAEIYSNQIDDASAVAIRVTDNDNAQVYTNQINVNGNTTFAGAGIQINGGRSVDVDKNIIDDTRVAGIQANDTTLIDIEGNVVTDAATDGIQVNGGRDADVISNQLDNVSNVAINVADNNDAQINNNGINVNGNNFTSNIGIQVNGGSSVDVDSNTVDDTRTAGIRTDNTSAIDIDGNVITDTQDGILAQNGSFTDIRDNSVTGASDDGIEVLNSDNADIELNTITDVADSGITVRLGSDSANILENTVNGSTNGIRLTGSNGSLVDDNDITGASNDGIHAENSDDLTITDNVIAGTVSRGDNSDGAGRDGINVAGSNNLTIDGNTVEGASAFRSGTAVGAGRHGISVADATGTIVITDNDVVGDTGFFSAPADSVNGNGINVTNSAGALVDDNTVSRTGENGINVETSANAVISNNDVTLAGTNGINVDGSNGATISDNTSRFTGEHAIKVSASDTAQILDNDISGAGIDGINIADSNDVRIADNEINAITIPLAGSTSGAARDGINVSGGENVVIDGNDIYAAGGFFSDGAEGVGRNGINVADNNGAQIINNTVNSAESVSFFVPGADSTGDDAIVLTGSNDALIDNNIVDRSGDDGIDVNGGSNITVSNNVLTNGNDDGIDVDGSSNVTLQTNTITGNSDNGIDISDTAGVIIDTNNVITDNGSNGIETSDGSSDITIADNTINGHDGADSAGILITETDGFTLSGNDLDANTTGIATLEAENGDITANTVTGSLVTGIQVEDSDAIALVNNTIEGSGVQGFYAKGEFNGDITLAGNTLTDNDIGALFESGNIDLTGASNTFTGGTTGVRFAPTAEEIVEGDAIPTGLTLVNDTLGTTIFAGQTGNYVELDNGAFFAAGLPTTIDATDVSFDGIIPSTFPVNGLGQPILTPETLEAIEAKIQDFDDLGTVGQIFTGVELTIENFEDFIRGFDANSLIPNGVNVTVLGLPALTANTSATFFAGITPAAGEGEESADDVAGIEPAAGGKEASCWSDAVSGDAQATSFTFGGSFEDSIASAANGCGTGQDS